MLHWSFGCHPAVAAPFLRPPQHTIDNQEAVWADQHVLPWSVALKGSEGCSEFPPDVCLFFVQRDVGGRIAGIPKKHTISSHPPHHQVIFRRPIWVDNNPVLSLIFLSHPCIFRPESLRLIELFLPFLGRAPQSGGVREFDTVTLGCCNTDVCCMEVRACSFKPSPDFCCGQRALCRTLIHIATKKSHDGVQCCALFLAAHLYGGGGGLGNTLKGPLSPKLQWTAGSRYWSHTKEQSYML